jgi:hypothetical protein
MNKEDTPKNSNVVAAFSKAIVLVVEWDEDVKLSDWKMRDENSSFTFFATRRCKSCSVAILS